MALLAAEMRHVDRRHGIGGYDLEDFALAHALKALSRSQHRQRTQEAAKIERDFRMIFCHYSITSGLPLLWSYTVPPHLSKLPFTGGVQKLLRSPERDQALEKQEVTELNLLFSGIEGDCHNGLVRKSDSRMLNQYRRGTDVRNARQVSILSVEELEDIAKAMGIPRVEPEWLGANMVTMGIPDLTLLPPSSRLQFPSGATIVIDIENLPCRYPAAVIEKHHADPAMGFIKAAHHKRGLVGWIERQGVVTTGDEIVVWIPPQRIYAHT